VEQALLRFRVLVIFTKTFQDALDVDLMNLPMNWRYEDVIEIDHYEDISHIMEDVVHKGLERSRSIGKSHWHDQELEGA